MKTKNNFQKVTHLLVDMTREELEVLRKEIDTLLACAPETPPNEKLYRLAEVGKSLPNAITLRLKEKLEESCRMSVESRKGKSNDDSR